MSRSVLRTVLGIVIFIILILGCGGAFVWWKISGLKVQLVNDLQKALGAQVQVASLDLDIWKGELHAAGIVLTNQRPSSPWEKGEIGQATLHFHLADVFAPSMPVTVEVSSWSVFLHSPLRTAETPQETSSPEPAEPPSGKGRIKVTQITAQTGTVNMDFSDDRKVVVQGVGFDASDNGAGNWNTQLQATSVTAGSFEAGASSVQIRGEPDKLVFSDLHMQCEQGVVTGEGNVALQGPHDAQLDLKSIDVPVTMLVAVDWQMKLSGLASGDLHYRGSDQGGGAKGSLSVNHGKFNVLPWIGKVTAMVGLQDISDVEVDKATSDFAWKDGALELTNLDIRKNDVTRIAGEVDIDTKGQVDGKLKLGLPSPVTAKWPQVQNEIFPRRARRLQLGRRPHHRHAGSSVRRPYSPPHASRFESRIESRFRFVEYGHAKSD